MWDINLKAGHKVDLSSPEGQTILIFVRRGSILLSCGEKVEASELGVLSRKGKEFNLQCTEDSKVFVFGGEPIDEPVVGHGPFVMNTKDEILQAIEDFQNGKMGSFK